MAHALPFTKMHGLGNDFVVVDALSAPLPVPVDAALARGLCDRRRGVGADQVVLLAPLKGFDAEVIFLNADGSAAETCGNGLRAVGLYLFLHGPRPGEEAYSVRDGSGPVALKYLGRRAEGLERFEVRMAPPRLGRGFGASPQASSGQPAVVAGQEIRYFEVNVGNPHAVLFVDRLEAASAEVLGPALERHADFPGRTNVEFVECVGSGRLKVRVWERGAGFTLACGSGACASAVAAIASGRAAGPSLRVELPGGELEIHWDGRDQLTLEGPAVEVFRGEFALG
ncbi:MAG: diaminopimelate epimerase [Bdellovibrionales bacterium]|nr:diaminopimelate epimerase [Bdellovibrionales bacterium]